MSDLASGFSNIARSMSQIQSAQAVRARNLYDAQVAMPKLLAADATFAALQRAVNELSQNSPAEHDVLILAFGIYVTNVQYVEPHTFIFEGHDELGHRSFVTCHFSQLVARVVYVPQQNAGLRTVTGFSQTRE